MKRIALYLSALVVFASCQKESSDTNPDPTPTDTTTYYLVFKYKFDSTQERLNNLGQVAGMTAGHAGQSPVFNAMSSHYIELAQDSLTLLGQGKVLYKAPETAVGGSTAIDFAQSIRAGNGAEFFRIPLKDITPGDYKWLRVSLAYQNYDVKYQVDTVMSGFPIHQENTATVASFIGFNTYLTSYKINAVNVAVNGNRKQGYWGFESTYTIPIVGGTRTDTSTGQAPEGATTVVNPIALSSPVPAGSCVVTGKFKSGKLTLTGTENHNIIVEVSLSTNKSFEWIEVANNGKWDPLKGEKIVDMGIRGMIPTIQ